VRVVFYTANLSILYLCLVPYPAVFMTHLWIHGMYVGMYVRNISSDDTTYVQLFRGADIAFFTPVALTRHWPHCLCVCVCFFHPQCTRYLIVWPYTISPSRKANSCAVSQEPPVFHVTRFARSRR